MAEPSANGGGENTSAGDQKAVKGWLSDLARGSRLLIRSTVAAGTVAGIATIVQMVLLARIIPLGIICLLYPSDAADESEGVGPRGHRNSKNPNKRR